MAGKITGLGTVYNLPNYTGILHQLTPGDTPFFSAIGGLSGGGQTSSDEFEWQDFDLRSAGQNVALEGADAPTPTNRVRANRTNIVQIQHDSVGVSYSKLAADQQKAGVNNNATNPVTNELDWQVEQKLKEMVRDIEYSFIRGTYQKPTDNTTPRKTRGLLAAITSNVITLDAEAAQTGAAAESTDLITLTTHGLTAGDQIVMTASAAAPLTVGTTYYVLEDGLTTGVFKVSAVKNGPAVDITADGSVSWTKVTVTLTKDHVDSVCQLAYDNGGIQENATATIMVNSGLKRAVTAAYSSEGYVTKELQGNVGGVTVDRINTDFGPLNVMLNRHMPASQLAIVSMEQCMPVYRETPGKGHFFAEALAKTGANEKTQLYGEVGLMPGNEMAHGKIVNLKA
ncbi:SU10 major capsid protein [Glycomyces arizonensis]|uniref:SU10 major capsid protein n=1 Tax=Glycomyces arizonensis TaxID=256035 RepID=UPI0003FD4678|nr:DUF5309 family protein [Glycomyces arizonensis]